MCTVAVVWLAGIPVADKAVQLAASLREAELVATAERLEPPRTAKLGSSRSTFATGEAILRVLEDCLDELLERRATLLREHVCRALRCQLSKAIVPHASRAWPGSRPSRRQRIRGAGQEN